MSEDLVALRHSAAHVMAHAILDLRPGARLGIGPTTADGFYYDVEADPPLSEADLPALEGRMREIATAGPDFRYRELTADEARARFASQPYKLELIEELAAAGEPLSTYTVGDFEDLCRGPHVPSAAAIDPDAVKLLRVSGAYWRGDESRPMLQRVYGTAWRTAADLAAHLDRLEEARRRDHRRLGEQLDLFAFDPAVGRGLPLWLPHGTAIREALEEWAKDVERRWGYVRVATPHITRAELYETSGHLPYFADDLYPPMDVDGDAYYLRPMNCPHHIAVYRARPHSYRDLPLRLAEYGAVYRYERSGELHGLLRVRGMTQNDAHVFCRLEEAAEEFLTVMRLHAHVYEKLGIDDFHMLLALRDPANTAKYHGDDAMWAAAERITREAMDASGIPYEEDVGGAAHYGPKVDFVLRSATGLDYGASTNQLDLYLPARFDLTFTNEHGRPERPVMIHRAPLGSHERFVAFLVEHYGGAFPWWLAPVQVQVIAVTAAQEPAARALAGRLVASGVRAEVGDGRHSVGAAVRAAEERKVPVMAVVGRREEAAGSVAVRARGGDDLGTMAADELVDRATAANAARATGI